jgi:hypothetical protein
MDFSSELHSWLMLRFAGTGEACAGRIPASRSDTENPECWLLTRRPQCPGALRGQRRQRSLRQPWMAKPLFVPGAG